MQMENNIVHEEDFILKIRAKISTSESTLYRDIIGDFGVKIQIFVKRKIKDNRSETQDYQN